jgi:hypothetical protein
MNLREFFNSTIQNGGASYNITTGELNPNVGYFVSVPNHEVKIPFSQFNADVVTTFINTNAELLSGEHTFVGTWIENNTVYLDVTEQLFDKRIALRLGLERNQLAIYDATTGKVINLPSERQTHGTLTQQKAYITSLVNQLDR